MIGYLTGTTIHETETGIILDVRGVGYAIATTEATKAWASMQKDVSLFVHTIVRETALDLYGFETDNELYFFKKLLDVSGIGPRSALGIIGLASTDTLHQAILKNNIDFLTSVPGIGKKTAERMCIELSDKLKDYIPEKESAGNDADTDVVDALVALGYSPAQAYKALENVDDSHGTVNERITEALKHL